MEYSLSDFDYHLPNKLIAQYPNKPRDHSRLLLLNRKTGDIKHEVFYNIVNYLQKGDVLVLNNSKVFPARLLGHKTTGGGVEIFLHKYQGEYLWQCLLKGRIRRGMTVNFSHNLEAIVLEDNHDGTWQVKFNYQGKKFLNIINDIGRVPLPPYIKRSAPEENDVHDYQTVFADNNKIGSVAAPTAGFHFTEELLDQIRHQGIKIMTATLHVGLGTFSSVKTRDIRDHKMHSEQIEVSKKFIQGIKEAQKNNRRIIAVGTTSCRILESIDLSIEEDQFFWTNIFIYPGYKFKVVKALITNFHLPQSSLLMLVSALAGKNKINLAYQEAIKNNYRFFSYGDAMFIC